MRTLRGDHSNNCTSATDICSTSISADASLEDDDKLGKELISSTFEISLHRSS